MKDPSEMPLVEDDHVVQTPLVAVETREQSVNNVVPNTRPIGL